MYSSHNCSTVGDTTNMRGHLQIDIRGTSRHEYGQFQDVNNVNHIAGSEIKSGRLYAQTRIGGKTRKLCVKVKVYSGNYERYAVIYPDKVHSGSCGYLNLRNCCVEPLSNTESSFRVLDRGAEGQAMTFIVPNVGELDSWLSAMGADSIDNLSVKEANTTLYGSRSPLVPRSPMMPTLEETDEDEP